MIRSVDLGDVRLGRHGQFRAPVRGVLVTPDGPARRSPLVVVGHLRYPGCPNAEFAYPCPRGRSILRFDRGMTYLGKVLARRGFSVLIPDLGPLYVGSDLNVGYDQRRGFRQVTGRMVKSLHAASNGRGTAWGPGLVRRVDTGRIGLLAHSRSATIARRLVDAWADTTHPIVSVMAYGGAYNVAYHGERGTTRAMPDIPYLGIVGDKDQDTGFMTSLWLGQRIEVRRQSPTLAVVVPGLGHTYVNRALSDRRIDDRICDQDCASAKRHRQFLSSVAAKWFGATMANRATGMPLRASDPLPAKLDGAPARWLATTNGPMVNVFLAGERGALKAFGPSGRILTCYPVEPLAPTRPGSCPIPDSAVSMGAARVSQVRLAPDSGVTLQTPPTKGVRGLMVHLAPSDDRTDGRPGNPVVLRVGFANEEVVEIALAGTEPALLDRASSRASGTYVISSLRVQLPSRLEDQAVTSIVLSGGPATSTVDVRAIDLIR